MCKNSRILKLPYFCAANTSVFIGPADSSYICPAWYGNAFGIRIYCLWNLAWIMDNSFPLITKFKVIDLKTELFAPFLGIDEKSGVPSVGLFTGTKLIAINRPDVTDRCAFRRPFTNAAYPVFTADWQITRSAPVLETVPPGTKHTNALIAYNDALCALNFIKVAAFSDSQCYIVSALVFKQVWCLDTAFDIPSIDVPTILSNILNVCAILGKCDTIPFLVGLSFLQFWGKIKINDKIPWILYFDPAF